MARMPHLSLSEETLRTRTSMKWRTYPADVLPLWVAEMDVHILPAVTDAVTAALHRGDTGYPSGPEYAEAFAAMARARWGLDLDPAAQIRRSGDVMSAILQLLLGRTEPGDGVLINPPVYPPFWEVIAGYGRRLVQVPLTPTGRLDVGAIEAVLAGPDRPSAYLLCSPHNPTGVVHTPDELRAVASACATHGVLLVVDEIHAPLVDAGTDFTPILTLPEASGAIVCTSAGKGWNLPAFKAGLFVRGADGQPIFDSLPPLANQSTGQMAKIAHTAALVHGQTWVDEVMAEVTANKALLAGLLAEHVPGAGYVPQPGTYLAWVDCAPLGLDDPQQHFLTHGRVAFNHGAAFGADDGHYIRINLATSPAILTEAIGRMAGSLG